MTQHSIEYFVDRAKNDLVYFTRALWRDRRLDRFAPFGWVEEEMLQYLQHGPNKQIIFAPRGFGKTHLIMATACWDLFCNPNESSVLIVSKSEREAKKTLGTIRGWIDKVPFLKPLKPKRDPRWKDSAIQFDVGMREPGRQPSVAAIGIDGQLEGNRASRLIGDDIETKKNTQTLDARKDLRDRTAEFSNVASYGDRKVNLVGTFHHEESVYLHLNKIGYRLQTWPLVYPGSDEGQVNLSPEVARRLSEGARVGAPVADYRIGMDWVHEKRAHGKTDFLMQQQGSPRVGDLARYPLRLSDFIVFPVNRDKAPAEIMWGKTTGDGRSTAIEEIESRGLDTDRFYRPILYSNEWHPYSGSKMFVDPSGRGKDATAVCIAKHLSGTIYIAAVEAMNGGHDTQTLERIAMLARDHRVTAVCIEDFAMQSMYGDLLTPHVTRLFTSAQALPAGEKPWRCSVEMVKLPRIQKEHRILDVLEPLSSQHRIVLDPSVAQRATLQQQITRLTRDRNSLDHDDEVDAMAGACFLFSEGARIDPALAAQRMNQQRIDEQLRAYRQRFRPSNDRALQLFT